MAKIVIDASVIVSSAFGGKPLEAVVRAMEDHEVYLSRSIEQELRGVISGLSRKLSEEQIVFVEEKIKQLVGFARNISVSVSVNLSRDAKDNHYLSLCKEAKANFLITGDKDLLNISQEDLKKNDISCQIVTPKVFLESVPRIKKRKHVI
jgi:putative PIN family toxin of toxin-antitoxin system